MKCTALLLLTFSLISFNAIAQEPLTIAGWNVEQGFQPDADLAWVTDQLTEMDDIDIWGLTEISRGYIQDYTLAAGLDEGGHFEFVMMETSPGDDLTALVFNANRLDRLWHAELEGFNFALSETTKYQRPPLSVHFLDRQSGQHFVVMVNHFAREEELRHTQSKRLQQWVSKQRIPIIAIGDYNFDWDVENGENNHDKGYDYLTEGGFFQWLRPHKLVNTQCTPTQNGGCRYNSVLDFIFVANGAKDWQGNSEIMVKDGDFPDDEIKSDHRPVLAKFMLPKVR